MIFPQQQWTRSTPESLGIDSGSIIAALEAIRDSHKDIHSMLIVRHGVLCFEQYFAPYTARTLHSMYSCSKTFTSMLIGIAQGKGLLSIRDKVLPYFPDVKVEHVNANLEQMTIRDLLMMGSGHGEDTFGHMMNFENGEMAGVRLPAPDFASVFLNQSVDYAPGTHFVYNTGATYMLSAILTRVTGKTAHELAKEWIFERIGIGETEWETCPKGISLGGTGLHIRPIDMARFGLLIMNRGLWQDEPVIPASYVDEASTKQISNKSGDPNQNPNWAAGYCYQMWRCGFDAFRADGMGGQYIVMLPQHELVFVFTSALGSDIGYPLDVIRDYLLPGIHPDHIPEDGAAQHRLSELSSALSHPQPQPMPDWPDMCWNTPLAIDDNPYGVSSLTFGSNALTSTIDGVTTSLPYRFAAPAVTDNVQLGKDERDTGDFAVSVYDWSGPAFRIQRIGTPATFVMRPKFDGDAVSIDLSFTMAEPFTLTGHAVN